MLENKALCRSLFGLIRCLCNIQISAHFLIHMPRFTFRTCYCDSENNLETIHRIFLWEKQINCSTRFCWRFQKKSRSEEFLSPENIVQHKLGVIQSFLFQNDALFKTICLLWFSWMLIEYPRKQTYSKTSFFFLLSLLFALLYPFFFFSEEGGGGAVGWVGGVVFDLYWYWPYQIDECSHFIRWIKISK